MFVSRGAESAFATGKGSLGRWQFFANMIAVRTGLVPRSSNLTTCLPLKGALYCRYPMSWPRGLSYASALARQKQIEKIVDHLGTEG